MLHNALWFKTFVLLVLRLLKYIVENFEKRRAEARGNNWVIQF